MLIHLTPSLYLLSGFAPRFSLKRTAGGGESGHASVDDNTRFLRLRVPLLRTLRHHVFLVKREVGHCRSKQAVIMPAGGVVLPRLAARRGFLLDFLQLLSKPLRADNVPAVFDGILKRRQ